ncbi:hypothetical protein OIE91_31490 [Streptomyces albidoflavus]|uniref:hypothetical protein n=1 Tax=Streptomyces TaxID=1883 RepID=UPI0013A58FC5|nr:hypothetical protein [Streptomyces sp. SM17]
MITTRTIPAAALTVAALAALLAPTSAAPASAAARTCATVEITHKTSVRRGPAGPHVRWVTPGQRHRSCYTERQPGGWRHACGARYVDHWVIKGGTIPRPCARKVA